MRSFTASSQESRVQIYRDRLGASIGSISTLADASSDGAIWPGRHDVAGSGRAIASNGTSVVDDRAPHGGLGNTVGALNAQSAM